MKLLVLNPNTTRAMTEQVVAEVRRLVPRWDVRGATAERGPAVIASPAAFEAGAESAAETLLRQPVWADAVLLACFGDPGLAQLRELTPVPVVGMAEPALQEAAALRQPFRIITAGAAWEGMLRPIVQAHRADAWLDGITTLEADGARVAEFPHEFQARVQAELDALHKRRVPTCVLAGAGFAALQSHLLFEGDLIDGIAAALRVLARPRPAG